MESIIALKFLLLSLLNSSLNPAHIEIPVMPDCDILRFENEKVCLACNIYHEARSETAKGMLAVANVTRNRVDSDRFPDNFCEVVWQRRQFSWTKDFRSDVVRNQQSWEESYIISDITVTNYRNGKMLLPDNTRGSLWYHADYIKSPQWTRYSESETKIGKHIFYTTLISTE